MSSPLKQNTITIQDILEIINSLPEAGAGGVSLPELSNPADASEMFSGKELIDQNGDIVTGTFSIDDELTTQDNLISQINSALQNKASASESEPVLQEKTVTPTTSSQTITPDNGYDGLSSVIVNAMPTATQATPSISVSSSGLITASSTQDEGYVSAGTKSATKQLTTQTAKTITPSTSSQTAVASGVYTIGTVTVGAIPNTYVKPTATKAATTYTPTTSNQTIAAGTYCSGAQTIAGDANLVAGNIKNGVSIFGVNGVYVGSGSSSGSSSSSTLPTLDTTAIVSSTAEGSVIYSYLDSDGNINTMNATLSYQMGPNKYRHFFDEKLIVNTLIAVLTSGTITMPTVAGYTCETIASGTGYAVYQYIESDGTPEEEPI